MTITLADILAVVDDLDDHDLHTLMGRVRDTLAMRDSSDLRDLLREVLAGHDPAVASVAFGTTDYDDGWFYTEMSATLTLVDGTVIKDVVIDEVEDQLRDLCDAYGPLGREAGLRVDLDTGEVEADTYMFA